MSEKDVTTCAAGKSSSTIAKIGCEFSGLTSTEGTDLPLVIRGGSDPAQLRGARRGVEPWPRSGPVSWRRHFRELDHQWLLFGVAEVGDDAGKFVEHLPHLCSPVRAKIPGHPDCVAFAQHTLDLGEVMLEQLPELF